MPVFMNTVLLQRKLKRGDETAYEHLFKTYYEPLVVFAIRFVYDEEDAKELVQDLFVSLYEKRHQLQISTSLKSYLYSAVRNKCLNKINTEKTKGKYEDYIKNNHTQLTDSIEQDIYKDEMEIALMGAIKKLPPKCKAIFCMNRMDGLSNTEIAEKLRISKRTVETQISKALKLLRTELKPFMVSTGYLILLWLLSFLN